MSEKERHFAVFQKKNFLDKYFLILNLFSIWFSSKHKVMTEVKIINVILFVQFFHLYSYNTDALSKSALNLLSI